MRSEIPDMHTLETEERRLAALQERLSTQDARELYRVLGDFYTDHRNPAPNPDASIEEAANRAFACVNAKAATNRREILYRLPGDLRRFLQSAPREIVQPRMTFSICDISRQVEWYRLRLHQHAKIDAPLEKEPEGGETFDMERQRARRNLDILKTMLDPLDEAVNAEVQKWTI